jgi:acetylglutamate kinase
MTQKPSLLVVKAGGQVIDNPEVLQKFLAAFADLPGAKILVHGGGKIATRIGQQLDIQPNYINGRRITDDATIDLVTMVYGGLINKQITAQLQALQCNALGLTGADGNIIPADKRPVKDIDYGWVGDVLENEINTNLLHSLLQQNIVPVLAPLTHDGTGHLLNTNADTIASAIAVALSAHFTVTLLFCFEKKGILKSMDNETDIIARIDRQAYETLLADGTLTDGIIPKIHNALAAVDKGLHAVCIGHMDDLHANASAEPAGTLITS